jgi:hypothetical protein
MRLHAVCNLAYRKLALSSEKILLCHGARDMLSQQAQTCQNMPGNCTLPLFSKVSATRFVALNSPQEAEPSGWEQTVDQSWEGCLDASDAMAAAKPSS